MIDLRSDTVTRPSADMRQAIAEAEVGDDVWGDDPTVKALEAKAAELLGKEAAVFVTSGTQSNLCALMAHCRRGDEYLVGTNAHSYKYEAGGAAVLGSIQPHPLPLLANGQFDFDALTEAIHPDDPHFAPTRLLCIENTHDGKVLDLAYTKQVADFAAEFDLDLHLDGARLWNAAVALGVTPQQVAGPFDTVSVCLSKGLGAPIGSVLAGSAELIARAVRWRKMLGGALRQTGIIAAAGIYALDNNIDRLADDHVNATRLADGLAELDGVSILANNTNMVFADFGSKAEAMATAAQRNNILMAVHGSSGRLVTHLDISADDVETVLSVLGSAANGLDG